MVCGPQYLVDKVFGEISRLQRRGRILAHWHAPNRRMARDRQFLPRSVGRELEVLELEVDSLSVPHLLTLNCQLLLQFPVRIRSRRDVRTSNSFSLYPIQLIGCGPTPTLVAVCVRTSPDLSCG
jgi:hypothetical protein